MLEELRNGGLVCTNWTERREWLWRDAVNLVRVQMGEEQRMEPGFAVLVREERV